MSICIIVQARMGSTRLPGKVMKKIEGKPMLELQLERLKRIAPCDHLIVATTDESRDDVIEESVKRMGRVSVFRGSEKDVLARYYHAALNHNASTVIRITSDCPLIDPEVSSSCISTYLERHDDSLYVSNCLRRSYPQGLDTEVFSMASLKEAFNKADTDTEREHVTPYIVNRPEKFPQVDVNDSADRSVMRWTVDTQEDFEFVSNIYSALYSGNPEFGYRDVLSVLEKHPEWLKINAHIKQKET